jgi:coenzyme PQQ precursor peptide PqqA
VPWTTSEPTAPFLSAHLFRLRAVTPLLHPAAAVFQNSTLQQSRTDRAGTGSLRLCQQIADVVTRTPSAACSRARPASRIDIGMSFALKGPAAHQARFAIQSPTRRHAMLWITPSYTELRFGFEVTMYIANR